MRLKRNPERKPARGPQPVLPCEWRWVAAVTVVALVVTCLPLLYGWAATPPSKVFTWLNRLNAHDALVYVAWMDQAARGHVLFDNRFTTEPHARLLVRPLFLVGGWLSRLPGLSPIGAYHVLRLVLGAVVLALAYRWIALFWHDLRTRRISFLLIVISSGTGWLVGLWKPGSADEWIPEAITFMSLYQSPLFLAGLALSVYIYSNIHRSYRDGTSKPALWAGLAGFVLAFVHPYDVLAILAVAGVWAVAVTSLTRRFPRDLARSLAILAAFVVPAMLYHGVVLRREPVFRAWFETLSCQSPSPWSYLSGFGLLLPLAVSGIPRALGSDRRLYVLPIAWIATTAVLLYVPVSFQRRLIQGVHLPLCLLGGAGLAGLIGASRPARAFSTSGLVVLVLAILSLSNVRMMATDVEAYRKGNPPYYLPREYPEALAWLRTHSTPAEGVLSSVETGYLVAALAGNRVYLGHRDLTPAATARRALVRRFFADNTEDDGKRAFLAREGIRYVFFSPVEQWEGTFSPDRKPYLTRVYENRLVRIYRVVEP